jgi:hypothetical protein
MSDSDASGKAHAGPAGWPDPVGLAAWSGVAGENQGGEAAEEPEHWRSPEQEAQGDQDQ